MNLTVIIPAIISLLVVIVTAWASFKTKRLEVRVSETSTVLDSWRQMVTALQAESVALRGRLRDLESHVEDCEKRLNAAGRGRR